jgi:hypothetical protein
MEAARTLPGIIERNVSIQIWDGNEWVASHQGLNGEDSVPLSEDSYIEISCALSRQISRLADVGALSFVSDLLPDDYYVRREASASWDLQKL